MSYLVDDFDFTLPSELIAQRPAPERTESRLLRVADNRFTDWRFADLPQFLSKGDLLVFNDTRVIKARLFGRKATGGTVEVLLERILAPGEALAQVRASKSPKPGVRLCLEDAFEVRVVGREGEFFRIELTGNGDFWQLAEQYGRLPLPPYITHAAEAVDEHRYQTVYASRPGAVAAPTAGLHFTELLLDMLRRQGVRMAFLTLHVGAGTFQPVRVRTLDEHRMHRERYEIPLTTAEVIAETRAAGGSVVAVGTTSLRALESAADESGRVCPGTAETDIFITPGYTFKVVDRLLTNFHLPRSTLLMLVSAFAGFDHIRAAYAHAIAERYRFFSYGDAMLLDRAR